MYLTKLSQRHGDDGEVTYTDLASVVQKKDSMEFLHDIVPKKIKYGDYCKMVEDSKDEEDDLFWSNIEISENKRKYKIVNENLGFHYKYLLYRT